MSFGKIEGGKAFNVIADRVTLLGTVRCLDPLLHTTLPDWIEKTVNIQAAAEQENVIIRFEFSGENGTYLYIDNIRLTGQWINIEDHKLSNVHHVVKKIDLLGREINKSNFYIEIYNNGIVKKKYEF